METARELQDSDIEEPLHAFSDYILCGKGDRLSVEIIDPFIMVSHDS